MSRIKAKGRTIPVQLPLPLDAKLRKIAARAGLTPGVWLSWMAAQMVDKLPDPK